MRCALTPANGKLVGTAVLVPPGFHADNPSVFPDRGRVGLDYFVPKLSTDTAAAFGIAQLLCRRGFRFSLSYRDDSSTWAAGFLAPDASREFARNCQSAAHAICLATLATAEAELERLRQRDAPAHTAGELMRIVIAKAREADAPEPLVGPVQGVAALHATELEPGGHVVDEPATTLYVRYEYEPEVFSTSNPIQSVELP